MSLPLCRGVFGPLSEATPQSFGHLQRGILGRSHIVLTLAGSRGRLPQQETAKDSCGYPFCWFKVTLKKDASKTTKCNYVAIPFFVDQSSDHQKKGSSKKTHPNPLRREEQGTARLRHNQGQGG